jgi:hypothetical protein
MRHTVSVSRRRDWHISRHWAGSALEDACPCPKEPCGMVPLDRTSPDCTQHPPELGKSIRRSHLPEECPGVDKVHLNVV